MKKERLVICKQIAILICFLFSNENCYSQAEFKIAVEKHEWLTYDESSVYLKIYLKVTNIGNQSGICDEINKLSLFCSQEYHNSNLNLIDLNKNLLSLIKPNDLRSGFIMFSVPKFADSIFLVINDISQIASRKFITESYYKSVNNKPKEKIDILINEGNSLYERKKYYAAIYYYSEAIKLKSTNTKELNVIISNCYEEIGKVKIDSNKLLEAVSDFKFALKYNERPELKDQLSDIYLRLGDFELDKNEFTKAEKYFRESYEINKNNKMSLRKLSSTLASIADDEYKKGFLNSALNYYYESLRILHDKNVNRKYEQVLEEIEK